MVLDLFERDSEQYIESVFDKVVAENPELQDRANRAALEKSLKTFMFWLIESCSFGLIKRISQAVGHSQLGETYKEVRESMDTDAVALIDVSIAMDNVGIPEDVLQDLAARLRGNIFGERLLRQIVVQHFYLFPSKEQMKQKVCALLDIPIRNLRGLDVKAAHERLAAPAH
jgi:hypothetical protein